jgi:hypothetical protein
MSKKLNPKIKFRISHLDELDSEFEDNIQVFEKFKTKPKTVEEICIHRNMDPLFGFSVSSIHVSKVATSNPKKVYKPI